MSTIERLAEGVAKTDYDYGELVEVSQATIQQAAAEYAALERRNAELVEALEKLARLGNGDHYGNSEGNMIARKALAHSAQEKADAAK